MNPKSSDADSKERTTQKAIEWRSVNPDMITSGSFTNNCQQTVAVGIFFKFIENSNSTCIRTWPFGEDNKTKKLFKKLWVGV